MCLMFASQNYNWSTANNDTRLKIRIVSISHLQFRYILLTTYFIWKLMCKKLKRHRTYAQMHSCLLSSVAVVRRGSSTCVIVFIRQWLRDVELTLIVHPFSDFLSIHISKNTSNGFQEVFSLNCPARQSIHM